MSRRADFSRFARTDALRADLKKKSIRGAFFVASSSVTDALLRFLSIAVLARLLSPEDFGLIAMVAAIIAVADSARDLGLSTATVQRADITAAQVTNLFWLNAAVGTALAIALSAAAPFIAEFYGDKRLVGIAIGLSLFFLWSGLTVQHEALLSRQLRQGDIAVIRLLASVISIAIAILLALSDWGYWALVWREVARSAFIAIGVWLRCPWVPGIPRRHVGTRSLLRFGGELTATNLLAGLITNVDKLLIGWVFGAVAVGMYRQAQQLVLAPIEQLNGPIISVGQPALSALHADTVRYRRYYEKIVFLITLSTFPVGLFVALYSLEVTMLLLGPQWREAAIFIQIFAVATMIRPALGTTALVLITCGKSTRFLVVVIIHGLVLAILLLLGVHWGPEGIALATVGTTLVLMPQKLYFSFNGTPATVSGFFRAIRAPVIAGVAMTAGLIILRTVSGTDNVLTSMMAGAATGAAFYCFGLWVQPQGRAELGMLWDDARAALQRRRRGAVAGLP